MFSFSLCASLITLIASAVAVSATPSLSVKASTPNVNVDGLENLKITTTIINTGNESLKLFNDPRGVLNPFPENTFIITNLARSRSPWFNGALVDYRPTYAAGLDDPSAFTVLVPGASINVTHDLSAAYNFTISGTGNYSIKPSSLFTYLDDGGTLKDLHATVEDIAEVRLTGNPIVSRALDRRAFRGCTEMRQEAINTAIIEAEALILRAMVFLSLMDIQNPPLRWTRWFGPSDPCDELRVFDIFLRMLNQLHTFNFDCDPCIGLHQTISHVPDTRLKWIVICPLFWAIPNIGFNSQAGGLIHQASRISSMTEHLALGVEACEELARDPGRQRECFWNADSYKYFAEDPE